MDGTSGDFGRMEHNQSVSPTEGSFVIGHDSRGHGRRESWRWPILNIHNRRQIQALLRRLKRCPRWARTCRQLFDSAVWFVTHDFDDGTRTSTEKMRTRSNPQMGCIGWNSDFTLL